MNRSPGRARSHMTTNPVSATLHTPFPLKARLRHSSSKVWFFFGKYKEEVAAGLELEETASAGGGSGESSVRGSGRDAAATEVEHRRLRSRRRGKTRFLMQPWAARVVILPVAIHYVSTVELSALEEWEREADKSVVPFSSQIEGDFGI